MNKRIDFSFNGGFPATQYMTDWMQKSYREAFMGLAGLIGDKVIVTGCQIVGDQVTNGWLSINGELVPFSGGPIAVDSQVVIVETNETRVFADDLSHTVYFTRTARIGSPGLFPFTDLKPASIMPSGIISMWSGAIADIPKGWALCDGTNGTPNLKGKFIVCYDAADTDYNSIGKTGGEKEHTLTINEMPSHHHEVNPPNSQGDSGEGKTVSGSEATQTLNQYNTEDTGGDQAHENRPPFYTLAYIIKL